MNPWVYTLPPGEDSDEFDVDSLDYEHFIDFIEENNHPGRMENGLVRACVYACMHGYYFY